MKSSVQIPRTHKKPNMSVIPPLLQWDRRWRQGNSPSSPATWLAIYSNGQETLSQTSGSWGLTPDFFTYGPWHTHEQVNTYIQEISKNYSRMPSMFKNLGSNPELKKKANKQAKKRRVRSQKPENINTPDPLSHFRTHQEVHRQP